MAGQQRPVVACYCATFLKPEMLHIYRQIVAFPTFRAEVIAQKREQADGFPFEAVTVLPRGHWRWWRRFWQKQLLGHPVTLDAEETRQLRQCLEQIRPSVLHIYFGHIAVQLMPLLAGWHQAPVIVSFHGADVLVDLSRTAYRRATQAMLARADLILARSESLIRALVELGCPPDKLRLHRTGIPLAEFAYRQRVFPPADGAWRLLQACRLIEKKGLFTSLRAFALFVKKYPLSSFTIAGDGPLLEPLQTLSRELGIFDRVRFPGFLTQAELRIRLHETHFFLHPSELGADGNQEGVPNSLLEAMSTGLPVIGSHHGGIPEAVEHGKSGWLIREGDADALAEGLFTIAADPVRMAAIGRAASEVVRSNFEQNAQAMKLESYYEEAMRLFAA